MPSVPNIDEIFYTTSAPNPGDETGEGGGETGGEGGETYANIVYGYKVVYTPSGGEEQTYYLLFRSDSLNWLVLPANITTYEKFLEAEGKYTRFDSPNEILNTSEQFKDGMQSEDLSGSFNNGEDQYTLYMYYNETEMIE